MHKAVSVCRSPLMPLDQNESVLNFKAPLRPQGTPQTNHVTLLVAEAELGTPRASESSDRDDDDGFFSKAPGLNTSNESRLMMVFEDEVGDDGVGPSNAKALAPPECTGSVVLSAARRQGPLLTRPEVPPTPQAASKAPILAEIAAKSRNRAAAVKEQARALIALLDKPVVQNNQRPAIVPHVTAPFWVTTWRD